MQNKIRRAGSSLGLLLLVVVTFSAGRALRGNGNVQVPTASTSVQASAMLKFTPECAPISSSKLAPKAGANRELVLYVVRLLKSYYVEPITAERETAMARGAARGMLDSLSDPDSHFMDPTERKLLDDAGAGHFSGMGAVLAVKKQKVQGVDSIKIIVVAPMPGSPADKAGLKAGDSITHVDGKWIITTNPFEDPELIRLARASLEKEGKTADYQKAVDAAAKKLAAGMKALDALDMLTSKTSGETTLTVERQGQSKPTQVSLQLSTISVPSIVTKTNKNGILYAKVSQFNEQAAKEFVRQINSAMNSSSKPKALILDLRNNPGGLMECASSIAGRIDGGGQQGLIEQKSHKLFVKAIHSQKLRIPVAVLVNGGTASVAELVAGTLRENSSAIIIGTKTFGDGMAQTPMILKDGSEAVLTTGKMLTSHGYDFEGKGIVPDKVVEDNSKQKDSQLSTAEQILLSKLGKA